MDFWVFRFFGILDFWIVGILEFLIFLILDFWSCQFFDMCSAFCYFVCCLFVVLCFWYTFVVFNVFLRVPKTESDFRCAEKAEFTDYSS